MSRKLANSVPRLYGIDRRFAMLGFWAPESKLIRSASSPDIFVYNIQKQECYAKLVRVVWFREWTFKNRFLMTINMNESRFYSPYDRSKFRHEFEKIQYRCFFHFTRVISSRSGTSALARYCKCATSKSSALRWRQQSVRQPK